MTGSRQRKSVLLGVDHFLRQPRDFLGSFPGLRRIGLLTHDGAWTGPAGPVEETQSRVALQRSGLPLVRLFSPEHGITASVPDGRAVPHGLDDRTGLPVLSLYGSDLRPSPEALEGLDLVLVDLQDVGARFYTYFWTLSHLMETCAEAGVPLLVLDRPNPLGGEPSWVEGPMPDPGFSPHFLARWPIPVRHSLTLGELARLVAAEKELELELGVVPAEGWRRKLLLTRTALPFHPPSPGLPSPESVLLYPGLALLEATNVWEGRGTPRAFRWFGAPWMDGEMVAAELNRRDVPGVRAHPQPLPEPHLEIPSPGVLLEITAEEELRPVALGLHLLSLLFSLWPEEMAWAPYPTAVHPGGEGHLHRLLVSRKIVSTLEDFPLEADSSAIDSWTRAPEWWERVEKHLLYE